MEWRTIDYKVHDQNGFNYIITKKISKGSFQVCSYKEIQKRKYLIDCLIQVLGGTCNTKPVENR
jgi:hypothetical protein